MAGAAEAIPVVGAVIAAVQMVKQEIAEIGEKGRQGVRGGVDAAKASLAMDPDAAFGQVTKGFDAVADKAAEVIPVLGMVTPAAKELVHGIDEMRGAVKQTAERLSQYSGVLAHQSAQQETTELLREVSRASRFEKSTEGANEARFNMDQKLQDITDRFMPAIMAICEKVFNMLEFAFNEVDASLKLILRAAQGILELVNSIPGMGAALNAVGISLTGIREMIRVALEDNAQGNDAMFDLFLQGASNLPTSTNRPTQAPFPAIRP